MLYRILADIVVVTHFGFVLFVVFGGFLALKWPRVVWIHVPCAIWGVLIEVFGWVCPLTPLEVHLRSLGGEAGYSGGFVERYLFSVLYPAGLTRAHQVGLGLLVLAVNVFTYAYLVYRRRKSPLAD